MNQLYDLLPNSISIPSESIIRNLESLSTINSLPTLTQLIPLLLSILALYATIISIINTTKFALKLAWFTIKWGSLIAILTSGVIGFKNLTSSNTSSSKNSNSLNTLGVGDMINMGKKGIDWWSGEGKGSTRGSRRSASGSKRTWSRVNSEGEWDDPLNELKENGVEDVIKKVQDVVLTFLGSGNFGMNFNDDDEVEVKGSKLKKKGKGVKAKKSSKKKEKNNGFDMAGIAVRYGANQFRKLVGF